MLSKALTTAAAGSAAGDYQISRSLRFNSADSAYLSRTPASAGNRKTWTWSGWVKRSTLGATVGLFEGNENFNGTNYFTALGINSSDQLYVQDVSTGASYNLVWNSSAVFRDPSAWYHIVCVCDVTQASSSNAIKIYVNGVEQTLTFTAFSGAYVQNRDTFVNATWTQSIGTVDSANYFNGYMADINFIDGQALTPSSFGETDETTGVWKPIRYAGTYGTNGFHLPFSDNSGTTSTTLGKDTSGNGNNWTPNNFSVTAGAGNDSLVDSPTRYGTDTQQGGEVRGNYATLNPIGSNTNNTYANGNLDSSSSSNIEGAMVGTIGVSSGKWYFETTAVTRNTSQVIGIANQLLVPTNNAALGSTANGWGIITSSSSNGCVYNNGTIGTDYGTINDGDIVGVAFDVDAAKLWIAINGTWVNSGAPASGTGAVYTNLSGTTFFPAASIYNGGAVTFNFGQRPWSYAAPSGFKALCTTNLPDPTVVQGDDHFNTVLYTGNGTTAHAITGFGFQPDWIWQKSRNQVNNHHLTDAVRGVNKDLLTNSTTAEVTYTDGVTSFDSDGFTVGNQSSEMNASGITYAVWGWKANGAGSSNTDGTITSTVSANTTAGISIVTCSPSGSAFTVGHGLGVAPKFIISKLYQSVAGWNCYHASLGADKYIILESTSGVLTSTTLWQNTAPTSTVLSFAAVSAPMLFYCFAEVEGFSKFGSYVGNGSADGPFVYTGFRPAWVLFKLSSNAGGNWFLFDAKRSTYNVVNNLLYPNVSNAEYTAGFGYVDLTSNGFKIRTTSSDMNTNAYTYIYMAFAERPFSTSLAR